MNKDRREITYSKRTQKRLQESFHILLNMIRDMIEKQMNNLRATIGTLKKDNKIDSSIE